MFAFLRKLAGSFLGGITGWFAAAIPGIVARVLAVLGLGIGVLTGLDAISLDLESFFNAQLAGFPQDMLQILHLAGFTTGLAMILAGVAAFLAIKAALGAFRFVTPQ